MDSGRTQELESLLQQALDSLVISDRRYRQTDLASYRANLLSRRKTYNSSTYYMVDLFSPHIARSDLHELILDFIREELGEYIHEDKTYAASFALYGGAFSGSPIADILTKLLNRTIMDGPRAAALALDDCTTKTSVIFQDFSLLTGIRVEDTLEVFDGVWLVPLPTSTADLPPYLPRFFQHNDSDYLSKTILWVDSSISPIFYKPPIEEDHSSFDPFACFGIEITSHEIRKINQRRLCQALSLACNSAVQWAIGWAYMKDEEIFNLSLGSGSVRYSPESMLGTSSVVASPNDISEAKTLYFALLDLPEHTQEALEVPIDRWVKSKAGRNPVDQMIDLGIAFESLYLADVRDELTFRFRLRAAWHLGMTHEERKSLMQDFKQIYDKRSEAVHTGKLPQNILMNSQMIRRRDFMNRAQDLCLQSIRKMISDGQLPAATAWDNIILGQDPA